MRNTNAIWIALFAVASMTAAAARAADGVLEINQACVATGCVPGDGPGFPVQLATGSYVLTSALTVSDTDTTAISAGNGVTIDLNGFEIAGVTACLGAPAACVAVGDGNGISAGQRASIRNGSVRRMGRDGIEVGAGSIIENVTVAENARNGINAVGQAHVFHHVRALQNGDNGVHIYSTGNEGSLVTQSTLYGNHDYGLDGVGVSVLECNVSFNGEEGLYFANGSAFGGNRISDNNGGDANDQVAGGTQIGINLCGPNTASCQ